MSFHIYSSCTKPPVHSTLPIYMLPIHCTYHTHTYTRTYAAQVIISSHCIDRCVRCVCAQVRHGCSQNGRSCNYIVSIFLHVRPVLLMDMLSRNRKRERMGFFGRVVTQFNLTVQNYLWNEDTPLIRTLAVHGPSYIEMCVHACVCMCVRVCIFHQLFLFMQPPITVFLIHKYKCSTCTYLSTWHTTAALCHVAYISRLLEHNVSIFSLTNQGNNPAVSSMDQPMRWSLCSDSSL